MKKLILTIPLLLALSACGADTPIKKEEKKDITSQELSVQLLTRNQHTGAPQFVAIYFEGESGSSRLLSVAEMNTLANNSWDILSYGGFPFLSTNGGATSTGYHTGGVASIAVLPEGTDFGKVTANDLTSLDQTAWVNDEYRDVWHIDGYPRDIEKTSANPILTDTTGNNGGWIKDITFKGHELVSTTLTNRVYILRRGNGKHVKLQFTAYIFNNEKHELRIRWENLD